MFLNLLIFALRGCIKESFENEVSIVQLISSAGTKLTPGSMYTVISADVMNVNWGELICQLGLPLQMSRYCFSEMLKRWTEKEGVKTPWNVWRKLSSVIGRMDKYSPDIGQKLREASGVGESRAFSKSMH